MKTLVVYSSQSGNTRRLAEAAYETLDGEKAIYAVDKAPDPSADDIVVVGFWLKAGKPDPKAADYLARVGNNPLFLIATHGAAAGSEHARNAMDHAKSLVPKATILGTFDCQGEVNPKILEKALSKDQPPPWLADAPEATGHPDAVDLKRLKQAVAAAMENKSLF